MARKARSLLREWGLVVAQDDFQALERLPGLAPTLIGIALAGLAVLLCPDLLSAYATLAGADTLFAGLVPEELTDDQLLSDCLRAIGLVVVISSCYTLYYFARGRRKTAAALSLYDRHLAAASARTRAGNLEVYGHDEKRALIGDRGDQALKECVHRIRDATRTFIARTA